MKSIYFIAAVASSFALTNCKKSAATGDTAFARSTFTSLVRGDSDVQAKIDWPTLTALGNNVGASYLAIQSETERQNFRNAFVSQFSTNFRESGGSVDSYTNWRVTFHDSLRTEVAADAPGGVLKITVTDRDSVERISSLDMVK